MIIYVLLKSLWQNADSYFRQNEMMDQFVVNLEVKLLFFSQKWWIWKL